MSDNPHILFVDDEANVLAALKRMLRCKRDEWEMSFVGSGELAMEQLRRSHFDVVVSDIRMPGMDGAELLSKVRDEFPGIIRIALSGQVDINEVLRSIRAVHQYISKPCESAFLIEKIEGTLLSKNVLVDQNLLNVITEIEALPVIPQVFKDIEDEMRKPEPSIEVIAEFVSKDVGLVAKILKLINSPYFGLTAHVDSVQKAITMLGLNTLKSLVISTYLFMLYDEKLFPDFSLAKLWEHSFRVSHIAQMLAECDGASRDVASQCRIAGMLHDIGKLILVFSFPDKYAEIFERVQTNGGPLYAVEMDVLGTTHAETGAYLLGLWGISNSVVHAISHHNEYTELNDSVAMYLYVANIIDHQTFVLNENYNRISFTPKIGSRELVKERLTTWLQYLDEHWDGMAGCDNRSEELIAAMLW
ncbi:response regulator [Pseudodesulfovibrio sediminis]|uniref:Two-component system response regulator n=1 Tax=Pseudodesulfovibrio sediminis TaxID=2810563 RepID=A0ABN6EU23_9BACT|nr:response regulator [Pseudodesulfovibrio sediminis]BCS89817.1 two-component system response regulator [Pseudodesulfovibrio sediminis]